MSEHLDAVAAATQAARDALAARDAAIVAARDAGAPKVAIAAAAKITRPTLDRTLARLDHQAS